MWISSGFSWLRILSALLDKVISIQKYIGQLSKYQRAAVIAPVTDQRGLR
jgi:hypothetical protein